ALHGGPGAHHAVDLRGPGVGNKHDPHGILRTRKSSITGFSLRYVTGPRQRRRAPVGQPLRRGYPCARMRCQTACFWSSVMKTQLDTSAAVRPQPRQISSNRVEQTATQGESVAVKACREASAQTASGAPAPLEGVLLMRGSLTPRCAAYRSIPAGRAGRRRSCRARASRGTPVVILIANDYHACFVLLQGRAVSDTSHAGRRRQRRLAAAIRQGLAGSVALYATSLSAQGTDTAGVPTVLPAVTVTGAPVALDEAPAPIAGGQIGGGARMGILGNAPVMDTPFSVTSYTAQTIENEQARSVADVATMDPSVRMGSARSNINEDLTIRGFSVPTSDFAFNGMFGLTPYWRAPVEALERIEIIKGPSAALFGMTPGGSVGGVVNLVPKRATDEPITRLTGSVMSDSVFGVHADIGRRFGPDNAFGIRVNAMMRDGDTPIKDQSARDALGSVALDYRGK